MGTRHAPHARCASLERPLGHERPARRRTARAPGRTPRGAPGHQTRRTTLARSQRLRLHKEFDEAFVSTKLPERPAYNRANEFLLKARRQAAIEPELSS